MLSQELIPICNDSMANFSGLNKFMYRIGKGLFHSPEMIEQKEGALRYSLEIPERRKKLLRVENMNEVLSSRCDYAFVALLGRAWP